MFKKNRGSEIDFNVVLNFDTFFECMRGELLTNIIKIKIGICYVRYFVTI